MSPTTAVDSNTTAEAAKAEPTTPAEFVKLRFAGVAALGAASTMPTNGDLQNIFDPRHRKVKKDQAATDQTAKTAAPAQPAAPPAMTATAAPLSEPPASELRTAAIPSRDERSAQPVQRVALSMFRVAGVDDSDTLNVRSGPSQYHPQVAAIPPRGRGVEITGACRDLWCPIRRGRVSGWVNSYYLAADAPGPSASRAYAAPGR